MASRLFIRQLSPSGYNFEIPLRSTFYTYSGDTGLCSRLFIRAGDGYELTDLSNDEWGDWSSFVYDSLEA